ncbi:lytic transglycosylase domain-containing protein [Gaiella sp.]|uniref:lytic transglycosylase domain-containing protein n=1 Tax=Gaiella sp. TaxID=2663207 RepID=UPI002E36528F|nr:lytic transglycosylase domain-containing protein [Gaiella sp.]HEX5585588.1 lytic transglycosylase domain-containing protein [Gaiella sp.]
MLLLRRLTLLAAVAAAAAGAFLYLQRTEPPWWARLWYPLKYAPVVRSRAATEQLDPSLLAAVIEEESKFNTRAKSRTGAIGLMQLQPATARGIAIRTHGATFVTSDLYVPEINISYGAWYLRHLMDKYRNEENALAAYNAGQQNVDRWLADGEPIQFPETRAYVSRVERLKGIYRRAYAGQLGLK